MKTMIAIPCMDMLHTDFARDLLSLRTEGQVQYAFSQASLVYEGRNTLAGMAIDGGFDRVLWLDSDMQFKPDLFERLNADLDEGRGCVTGLYFTRKRPIKPVVYKAVGLDRRGEEPIPKAESYHDWPEDTIFPVAACGFGAVMMTTELLRKVRDAYKLPFSPVLGFGEDLSFCMRCTELGETIWCDSRIQLGHVGLAVYNEKLYREERSRHE